MDDDGVLVARFRDGDVPAFEELVRRHAGVLLAFLLARTRDRPLAEDLLQETFLRVLTRLDAYEHRGKFRSWLFRIGHNLVVDHARARRTGMLSLEERSGRDGAPGPSLGESLPADPATRPERIVEARDELAAMRRALDGLTPAQREVVLLREAGIPFREIARMQDCSINTALGRMHDALRTLRRALGDDA